MRQSEPALSPALPFDSALPSPASGTGGTAMAEHLQALQTRVDSWDARINELGSTVQAIERGVETMRQFLIRLYPNDPMGELEQPFARVRSLSRSGSRHASAAPSAPPMPSVPMDVDPDTRSHVSGPSVNVVPAPDVAPAQRERTPLFLPGTPLAGSLNLPEMAPRPESYYERQAYSPGRNTPPPLFGPRPRRDEDTTAQPSRSDSKK